MIGKKMSAVRVTKIRDFDVTPPRKSAFQIETRHYGDLEALRTNTVYCLSAVALGALCIYVFTRLLEKRTVKAGNNAISAVGVFMILAVAFNFLPPTTKLPLSSLKKSALILNTCVYSEKGGKRVGNGRDCLYGEGATCSLKNPCTPCNPIAGLDQHIMFDVLQNIYRNDHCRKCTPTNQYCPNSGIEDASNYCRKQGYKLEQLDEKIIDGTVSSQVAGWETIHVEQCQVCCVTNRTMEFLADRKLSEHHGALNLGAFKNVTIAGSTTPQKFQNIYTEILDILKTDPSYFVTVGGEPNRSMINYTEAFGVELYEYINVTSYCATNPC